MLKENLDCKIACFAGDHDPKDKTFWEKQLKDCQVIVCVGAVLQSCLHRAYIKMEQINLLIFDEAHHAKREHPYARILTDFYVPLQKAQQRLPHIFGMTASPVDAKTDFERAASDLETLLHSKIATAGDLTALQSSSVHKAEEHVVEFSPPGEPFDTALLQKLKPLLGKVKAADKALANARLCTSELGPWCADQLWRLAFDQEGEGLKKLLMRLESEISDVAARDDACEAARAAQDVVHAHRFVDLASSRLLVSNKAHRVFDLLQETFRPGVDKCVIFVAKRYMAVLLVELLQSKAMRIEGVNAARMVSQELALGNAQLLTTRTRLELAELAGENQQ